MITKIEKMDRGTNPIVTLGISSKRQRFGVSVMRPCGSDLRDRKLQIWFNGILDDHNHVGSTSMMLNPGDSFNVNLRQNHVSHHVRFLGYHGDEAILEHGNSVTIS